MRVLVTGARGYVGSKVVAQLQGAGAAVAEVDSGWFAHARVTGNWSQNMHGTDFRMLTVDDLSGFDTIVHLAGYSNDPMGWLSPQETYALNETEAAALAVRAKKAGVKRFVLSSTCSVYGEADDSEKNEMDDAAPITPYGAAKLGAERALLALHDDRFNVAILRGATAFGPSPVPRTDLLLNELCAEAALGRPLQLQSDGQSWRPFMPVDDFARALAAAAVQTPQTADLPIWNIAPPDMQMTVREAATRAARVAKVPLPLFPPQSAADRRSYRVSGTKFLNAFPNFAYSTDFDAAIAATIQSYAAIATLQNDLSNDRFVRLASFKRAQMAKTA